MLFSLGNLCKAWKTFTNRKDKNDQYTKNHIQELMIRLNIGNSLMEKEN